MNTEHILQVAREHFTELNDIGDNIYKANLTVANKLAGVYYFDLNNSEQVDFESYQERLLAEEFYSRPGDLQWNYYLFLLNDKLSQPEKDKIEKNDKYARKFVLNEDEFDDFFTLDKSESIIRPNIVADWKRRLDEVGLSGVYSNRTYVSIEEEFKNATTIQTSRQPEQRIVDDADKIRFINRLVLKDQYRKYPIERNFRFGKVNLFRGINGVGKTSLFEAIEAMICGKCFRNPKFTIPQGSIEAQMNGSATVHKFDGKNNKKFMDRDLFWYANNTRINTLYNSFNRFNFFNADAAHSFSIANTEIEASEALFSIILGPEYHYISERNARTLERLRPELNRLNEQMQQALDRKRKAEKITNDYREPIGIGRLRDIVQNTYTKLRFKKSISAYDLSVIEEGNNAIKAILKNLLPNSGATTTTVSFDKDFSDYLEKKKTLENSESELRNLNETHAAIIKTEKELNNTYDFLTLCLTYVQDEKLLKLDGLQLREGEARLLKSKIDFVSKLTNGLLEDNSSLLFSELELSSKINELEKTLRDDEAGLNALVTNLGKISAAINQVKFHGKEVLELDKDVTSCPLCQTQYTRSELEARVLEAITDSEVSPLMFEALKSKVEGTKQEIALHNTILQDQGKIKQAFNAVFSDKLSSGIVESVESLKEFLSRENAINQDFKEIEEIKRYADSLNRTEKELNELKLAYRQQYNDELISTSGNIERVKESSVSTLEQLNNLKTQIVENGLLRTEVGNRIKKLLGVEGESIYLKDIRAIFQKEESNMLGQKNSLDKLKELIEIPETTTMGNLIELSDSLTNNIESLRNEQKVQFEYDGALKDQREASVFIGANEAKLNRYNRAVTTLRELTGDEASAHVSAFFDDNFQEIVDIFKAIHVPKEFVRLRYSNERLELITETGETRSISQISTGQRSALALSIFLSLNGKLSNGPDLILFDDPVAFIDDLNALSFLDYLRINTLNAGKQIFFATANMRLASLFEKKFGFLDDDFKIFDLSR